MSHKAAPESGSVTTLSQRLLAPGDGLRGWWSSLGRPAKWIFGVIGFTLLALLPLHTPGFIDTPGISFGGTMAAFVMVAIIAIGLNVVTSGSMRWVPTRWH
jgi:branched-chain amino acid transport system permease protein